MKRKLFWLSVLPLGIALLILAVLSGFSSFIGRIAERLFKVCMNAAARYEGWCFDMAAEGWEYDDGLWRQKPDPWAEY